MEPDANWSTIPWNDSCSKQNSFIYSPNWGNEFRALFTRIRWIVFNRFFNGVLFVL